MNNEELKTALASIESQISEKMKSVKDEVKENGKASDDAVKSLNDALAEQKELVKSMQSEITDLYQKQTVKAPEANAKKSLGQLFVESDVYSNVKSTNRGDNQPFAIDSRAITLAPASAEALVNPFRDPTVYEDSRRVVRIRDLIPMIPTSTGAVEFMRQNVFTNNAGPQENEFDTKNESDITWELISLTCSTIAHWVAASRQALSDAPMLQGLIDVDLRYGLQLESDEQLLLGDGTGGNMTGLLVDADIPTVGELPSTTTPAEKAGAMIDHIRSAVTTCQTNEYYNMTGIVLNPVDWEILETAKATDGHYLMIQFPSEGASERIWRMPVVVTNAMPADNFILGDWTMGAKIYDRESVEIRVSESHADYFVKNGVAVLAEERYVLGIQRPKAFCKGLFTIAP